MHRMAHANRRRYGDFEQSNQVNANKYYYLSAPPWPCGLRRLVAGSVPLVPVIRYYAHHIIATNDARLCGLR